MEELMEFKEFVGTSIDDAKEKAMDYFNSNHIEFELMPAKFFSVITGKNSVRIKARKYELSKEHDEHIAKAKNFIVSLLKHSLINIELEEKHQNSTVVFELKGEDEALLLNDKGALLDAFQHILVKHSNGKDLGINYELDCADYKKERETFIKSYVNKACSVVKKTNNPYIMKPLNPSERRIVHMYVQNEHGLQSESIGEGFYKKVKIDKTNSNAKENA